MKNILAILAILTLCVVPILAQNTAQQSFTMAVIAAPPTVVVGANSSTSTSTAASTSTVGGTVAAGTYRICVTYFSTANTETPCSVDTSASSVITTTGSTSTVTVQPPVLPSGPPSVVGYRVYVGASGGAAAGETLQTLTAAICTLSASSTASCALTSPAVFTSSANFSGGSGGPATPGTLFTYPVSNAANLALFENSQFVTHILSWTVSGTAPGTCTVQLQTGAAPGSLANVGQSLTCTATGSYALPSIARAAFVAPNVSVWTGGDTTSVEVFTITAIPYVLGNYWGPATPTGNCPNGVTFTSFGAASASTALYICQPANTWTAVTVP